MKLLKDYSFVRGFNYTQSNVWTDVNMWESYDHDIVERDMGYAERLKLNSARIFLTYSSYLNNKDGFLRNVKDFVQTAWKHGISTNPIVFHGIRLHHEAGALQDPSRWVIGERYFDDLCDAIGSEPGLLFWDISNEPGYRENAGTWYDDEPDFQHEFCEKPADMEQLRRKQDLVWAFIRHFCKYIKSKDPNNAIGIGNTLIWETEPSGTIDDVDIIVFHDYSDTDEKIKFVCEYARKLSEKYGKPVINNETGCLCRGNRYDMEIQMMEQYGFGYYLFELMIGADVWNRVHGIVYPDGTVRDPSIVSSLFGFHRKRDEGLIPTDVDQERYARRAVDRAEAALNMTRNGISFSPGGDHSHDTKELLNACECIANLLEAGQLVPMDVPPTYRINMFRRQTNPNTDEIKRFLCDLVDTLKKACFIVK